MSLPIASDQQLNNEHTKLKQRQIGETQRIRSFFVVVVGEVVAGGEGPRQHKQIKAHTK